MSFPLVYPPPPNQVDFTTFLRNQAGIPVSALPDNSPYIPDALQLALDIVNADIDNASPDLYTLAVYNLATDRLINFAPDQTPAIAAMVWASGVVAVQLASPLPSNLPAGQQFQTTIAGVTPSQYNGTVTATVLTAVGFSYPLAANPGNVTVQGTFLLPFFQTLRKNYNILSFTAGVVESASDNGTATTLSVPEQMRQFTMSDLQRLKTPFGRTYLEIAQTYGQTLFGVS